MKLIFCIKQLDNVGGMERVLIDRVNYLIKYEDIQILIVITDSLNRKSFFEINNRINIENLEVNYNQDREKNIFFRAINLFYKQWIHKKKLEKLIFKYKPDIIISLGNEDKYILTNIDYPCKKILEHHFEKNFLLRKGENGLHKLKNIYLTKKEERLLKRYDEFLVLTEEDKKQWSSEKIKVIYNPISFYPSKSTELKNKKIISVGRLEYQKGYDILIDVWKRVIEKNKDWVLEIYGDGTEREKLQNKINNLGLRHSFLLKGTVKNIQEKYLESSIYVMTSRFEGMPMVLLEAQACGLPIISFDCPCGPKEIINDNIDGFICKFNDIDKMAEKLIFLMNNEKKRKEFSISARENVKKFSQDKIMEKWINLFSSIIKK